MRFEDDYGIEGLEFSLKLPRINIKSVVSKVVNFVRGNRDKIQRTIAIWKPSQPTPTTPAPPRPSPTPRTYSSGNNWLIPIGLLFGLYLISRR